MDDVIRISIDAARALDYAQRHGVIRRDVTPENTLLTREGAPWWLTWHRALA